MSFPTLPEIKAGVLRMLLLCDDLDRADRVSDNGAVEAEVEALLGRYADPQFEAATRRLVRRSARSNVRGGCWVYVTIGNL
jgi:hypothetical protein